MTHPNDELLSAFLDGEHPADLDPGHLDACETCGTRLAALRAVAAVVGEPVPPPPPAARDRAVEAALRPAGASTDAGGSGGVVRRLSRRPRHARWLAAAAAVAALAVGAPLVARLGDGRSDERQDVAAPAAAEAAAEDAAPVVGGGDLGDRSDAEELASLVRAALAAGPGGAHEAQADSEGPADSSGGAGRTSASEETTAAAPMAAAEGAGPTEGPTAHDIAARCEPLLREGSARLGPLGYVATLRWQGTPAGVLGFRLDGDDIAVYVVAAEDCAVLNWSRS